MNPQLQQTLAQMNQMLGGLVRTLNQLNSTTAKLASAKTAKIKKKSLIGKGVDKASNSLTSNLIRVFGPLVALGTLLSATTSGFHLFLGSIRVAATAAGAILLPVFAVFSAAILTFVEMLTSDEMLGALKSYYDLIFKYALELADNIKFTAAQVREFGIGLKAVLDTIQGKPGGGNITDDNKAMANQERERVSSMIDDLRKSFIQNNADFGYGTVLKKDNETGEYSAQVKNVFGEWVDASEDQLKRLLDHQKRIDTLRGEKDSIGATAGQEAYRRNNGEKPNADWSGIPKSLDEFNKKFDSGGYEMPLPTLPDPKSAADAVKKSGDALAGGMGGAAISAKQLIAQSPQPGEKDFVGPVKQIEVDTAKMNEAFEKSAAGRAANANPGAKGNRDSGQVFREMLPLVARELQVEAGPKPQQFSLAAVNRQAQIAALGASPFEAKMTDITQKILNQLIKSANDLPKDSKPLPTVE